MSNPPRDLVRSTAATTVPWDEVDEVRRRTRLVTTLAAAGTTAGWLALATWVASISPEVPGWDQAVHDWAVDSRTGESISIALGVTVLGQTDVALPLVVVAAVAATVSTRRFGRARAAATLLAVGSVGALVGLGLNHLVGRARPAPEIWAGTAGGPSFPSGHTTVATLGALLVAWAVTRPLRSRVWRAGVWSIAVAVALAVGWTRVWLGVHWPSDVLCAWLFATSFLLWARTVQLWLWPGDAPPATETDAVEQEEDR